MPPLIRLHHLDHSRSFRILWLLEELEVPYELVAYQRDPVTRLAPPALEAVHPLGKAPMLEDEGRILHESGAIVEHVIERHGGGRLAPGRGTSAYDDYRMWLHFAEGSAMLPIMIDLYARTRGAETPALRARVDAEIARHLDYLEAALVGRRFLVGDTLTGADIQMAYVAEVAERLPGAPERTASAAWLAGLRERPAFRRARDRGGPAAFPPRRAAAGDGGE